MAAAKFDLDYYGLRAAIAGVHFGWPPNDTRAPLCRGRVLWVKLPGPEASARLCERCLKTQFRLPQRHSWGEGWTKGEVIAEGDSCPDCSGRGGHDDERSDGMCVGWIKCGSCEATGRVKARLPEGVIERLAWLGKDTR